MSTITGTIDPGVISMVKFFNENGLPTHMSCQGHNKTNMSMFWIEFDRSVTEDNVLNFMKDHLNAQGTFVSCGRFAKRLIGFYNAKTTEWSKAESWCYFAATVDAADADLQSWQQGENGFDGVNGEHYQAYRSKTRG